MPKLRVGLNGLGRIGRAIFRINQQRQVFDIVLINERRQDAANLAYALQYDSIYGKLDSHVSVQNDTLWVDRTPIALSHGDELSAAPWRTHDVDVLIDASGNTAHPAQLLAWQDFPGWTVTTHAVDLPGFHTVIFGVNDHNFDAASQRRLSTSICDAVALAPIAHFLQQHYGICRGTLLTLHPWLSYQPLQDGLASNAVAADDAASHFALGRSAVNNLIPKPTSAVNACNIVLPGLSERIAAMSFRVPTNIVSSAVLNVELVRPCSSQTLSGHLQHLSQQQRWPILQCSHDPTVSLDYCGDPHAVTVDHRWSSVRQGHHARLVYWYDNEWGYASRVVDLIALIAEQQHAAQRQE